MKLYSIANWNDYYENNRSRTVKDLAWVPIPNRHDGESYSRLMMRLDAAEIFTAWILMLQVASRCQPRGSLVREGGKPHDSESLAIKTRSKAKWFEKAFEVLMEVGWLDVLTIERQEGVSVLSASCQAGDEEWKGREGKESPSANDAPFDGDKPKDDGDFLTEIKPLYPHCNIDLEINRMKAWLLTPKGRGRKLTKRFVVNWLNKIDAPISLNGSSQTKINQI